MSLSDESQVVLKVQRAIRGSEDDLVLAIQEALDRKKFTYGNLEEAQFRNLVRVALTTESTEVIVNFLRYQVGRDDKWGRGRNSLAERIIDDIQQKWNSKAEAISRITGSEKNPVHIELVRRYLGYGARYLKYLNLNDGQTSSAKETR
jgi:hypothetical protein